MRTFKFDDSYRKILWHIHLMQTPGQISQKLGMKKPTLSKRLGRLEKNGFIERRREKSTVRFRFTEKGAEALHSTPKTSIHPVKTSIDVMKASTGPKTAPIHANTATVPSITPVKADTPRPAEAVATTVGTSSVGQDYVLPPWFEKNINAYWEQEESKQNLRDGFEIIVKGLLHMAENEEKTGQ